MRIAAVAVLLAGCSTMQPQPPDLSSIQAAVNNPNGSVICTTVIGPWGTAKIVAVTLDKGVVKTGGVSVDANCTVNLTEGPKP